ncbi:MAG: sulfite reductase subunit A, partial [Planctomycetaceae bacterium]|nr:sulfite reductase subunit A [Planctomycetaceae bacterium]
MTDSPVSNGASSLTVRFLPLDRFPEFLQRVLESGYRIVAPTVDQQAIVYAEIQGVEQLPRGWTDEQKPGHYRVLPSGNDHYFDYAVGPHSWKKYLFPPLQMISTALKTETGWTFHNHEPEAEPIAFLGVRACELAAIQVQDRVFLQSHYVDPGYQARRSRSLIIAVNCAVPSENCFCTSMQTGPRCTTGFDVALTELEDGLLVEVASAEGAALLEPLALSEAAEEQLQKADQICQTT